MFGVSAGCQHTTRPGSNAASTAPALSTTPLAPTPAAPPSTQLGAPVNAALILAAKVVGDVAMTQNERAQRLSVDQRIPSGVTVTTEKDSLAVLVFSNGTTLQLGEDTSLALADYFQDPFARAVKVAELVEEPSVSRTRLRLLHGTVIGEVKRLKLDHGSSFQVETPVGEMKSLGAGGTFQLEFGPAGSGQAAFRLKSGRGDFVLTRGDDPAKTIRVPEGQQIAIDVSVTAAPERPPGVSAP
jgi:hypothetical protein